MKAEFCRPLKFDIFIVMPSIDPTAPVSVTTSMDVSPDTRGGIEGSSVVALLPGRFLSRCVLTSPMPSNTFFWQAYWIGSSQFSMIGNPSAARTGSTPVAPGISEYSGTLPWFFRYRNAV